MRVVIVLSFNKNTAEDIVISNKNVDINIYRANFNNYKLQNPQLFNIVTCASVIFAIYTLKI